MTEVLRQPISRAAHRCNKGNRALAINMPTLPVATACLPAQRHSGRSRRNTHATATDKPNSPRTGRVRVQSRQGRPARRPTMGQTWRTSGELSGVETASKLVQVFRIPAVDLVEVRATLGPHRSAFGQMWSKSGQSWPIRTQQRQIRPTFGRLRPIWDRWWPRRSEYGQLFNARLYPVARQCRGNTARASTCVSHADPIVP